VNAASYWAERRRPKVMVLSFKSMKLDDPQGRSSEMLSVQQQREMDAYFIAELKRLGSDLPYEEFADITPGVEWAEGVSGPLGLEKRICPPAKNCRSPASRSGIADART